jgi:hypothetical protein
MIEQLMQLHRCADCPIRCQAMKKPRSIFARMHRWHQSWWPGWKFYQRQLRDERMMRVMEAGRVTEPRQPEQGRRQHRPARAPELVHRPAAA